METRLPVNEKTIGMATVLEDVVKHPLTNDVKYQAGQRIEIAHYALSADRTLAYYRVSNTLDWFKENELKINKELAAMVAVTKNKNMEPSLTIKAVISNNRETKVTKSILSETSGKQEKQHFYKIHKMVSQVTNKGHTGMDKKELRAVLNTLKQGQVVEFNFIGNSIEFEGRTFESGPYTVLNVRNGRGRCGSRLAELHVGKLSGAPKDGQRLVVGTPNSDKILNLRVNEKMHGYETEAEMPTSLQKDGTAASLLKEGFKRLLDAEGQYTLDVRSSSKNLNGKFTVMGASLRKGRGGQIALTLQRFGTDETVELWSYRHSALVNRVQFRTENGKYESLFTRGK